MPLRILLALENNSGKTEEIAKKIGASYSATYYYLKMMAERGHVESTEEGYRLTERGRVELERIRREICPVLCPEVGRQ